MVTIIDYKAGNLASVFLALSHLGIEATITSDPNLIRNADRVIFPGDGAAKSAMTHLKNLQLLPVLHQIAKNGTPFLGICVGTQIILDESEEDRGTKTIGLLPGKVRRFQSPHLVNKHPQSMATGYCPGKGILPQDQSFRSASRVKIPHMGWNTVSLVQEHPVFTDIENDSEFYFIHSYYPIPKDDDLILGKTQYADVLFSSIIGRDNILATQFHPERSGRIGMKLLENFCQWDGSNHKK